jgi:putative flippase GtrA
VRAWLSRYARGVRSSAVTPARETPGRPGFPRVLYDRFAHLVREIGKFGIVGGVCYGIDIVIFAWWNHMTGQRYVATTISTVVAATIAFIGNRFWTWRHRERTGLHREYALYFAFNAIGLAIGIACLFISSRWLGAMWPSVFRTDLADLVSGKVVGVLLASLFRFWAYRRFVFRPGTAPTAGL